MRLSKFSFLTTILFKLRIPAAFSNVALNFPIKLPSGLVLNSMMDWSNDDGDYLILLTNQGISIAEMQNGVPQIDSTTFEDSESSVSVGSINEMVVLSTGSGSLDLMLFSNHHRRP